MGDDIKRLGHIILALVSNHINKFLWGLHLQKKILENPKVRSFIINGYVGNIIQLFGNQRHTSMNISITVGEKEEKHLNDSVPSKRH